MHTTRTSLRHLIQQGIALIVCCLVLGGCTLTFHDDARPTPTAVITTRDSADVSASCSHGEPAALVTAFIDAINREDRASLSDMLPQTEGSFEQGLAGDFGLIAYAAFADGATDFSSRVHQQVLDYLVERHQHNEQQRLNTLEISPSHAPDSVDIVYNITREADDMEPTEYIGKGAIDCQKQTIYLWVMDDDSDPA